MHINLCYDFSVLIITCVVFFQTLCTNDKNLLSKAVSCEIPAVTASMFAEKYNLEKPSFTNIVKKKVDFNSIKDKINNINNINCNNNFTNDYKRDVAIKNNTNSSSTSSCSTGSISAKNISFNNCSKSVLLKRSLQSKGEIFYADLESNLSNRFL